MRITSTLTVFLLLVFMGSTYSTYAQCTINCPPTPPIIVHDGDKDEPIITTNFSCWTPSNGTVGMSYEYQYEFLNHPSSPDRVTFTFYIKDGFGYNIDVNNPTPVPSVSHAFSITFYPPSLTNTPSGPYNAYIDGSSQRLVFDLDFNTNLPINYPVDLHLKPDVQVEEENNKNTYSGFPKSFEIDICPVKGQTGGGKRNGLLAQDVLEVKPNPFNDYVELNIKAEASQQPVISLYNLQGQSIDLPMRLKYVGENLWISSQRTHMLPPGIYVYNILVGGEMYRRKIIKH